MDDLKLGGGENLNRDGGSWPGGAGGKSDSGHEQKPGAKKIYSRIGQ
jgi:hypothetical protein